MLCGMVPAESRHDSKQFTQLVGILHIDTRGGLVWSAEEVLLLTLQGVAQVQSLTVTVVIDGCSHTQVMLRSDVGLIHQLCITVLLVHLIQAAAYIVVRIMHGPIEHESHRGVMLMIDGESVLPLQFISVGGDIYAVEGHVYLLVCMSGHTALPLIMESFETQLAYPEWRYVCHAPHTVVLSQFGHIHESIPTPVMIGLPILEMEQTAHRESVREMQTAIHIGLLFQVGV